MKRGILVFILAAICALAFMAASGTYKEVIGSLTGTMTFDSTLDTAAVVRVGGYSALDSFDYVDSLLAGKTEVKWTSPVHIMIQTPTAADSGVYLDTLVFESATRLGVKWVAPVYQMKVTFTSSDNSATYVDTIKLASGDFDITWTADGSNTEAEMCDSLVAKFNAKVTLTDSIDAEDSTTFVVLRSLYKEATLTDWVMGTDTAQDTVTKVRTTVAMVCDSLTAAINAAANLTDSVTAEDSAAYVKIVSLFGNATWGARWTTTVTSNIDTALHANAVTIKIVTDSMAASVNAKAVVTDSMTAANTGDTAYTLTMDNTGQALNLKFGDTAQDSTWLVLNKADWSTMTAVTKDIGRADGFNSLRSQIVMNNVQTTDAGVSLADTGKLWLYSGFAGTYVLIDSSVTAGLPCSLNTVLVQAIGDSAIRPSLRIKYQLKDSTTDTSFSASFPVSWKIFLK